MMRKSTLSERQNYIFYDKNTGRVMFSKSMHSGEIAKILKLNPTFAYIQNDTNIKRGGWRVDVDTQQLEPIVYVPTTEEILFKIRLDRNVLLEKSDWTQGSDSPLTAEQKAQWSTYRQALRDLPAQYIDITDIDDVVWPKRPS